ncbi:phage baseplate assembly protein V [Roseateles sp. UC29_93]|uniref:phage baseplate assembly protein V n=1 Tax=Roseateles sp. UC29_93 TaxID=3350177 RepID=UPI0036708567
MDSPDISDVIRRLENLLRAGTIEQVDHEAALVRVRTGGLLSSWVRAFARRAGVVREWSPPSVGEQCLLFSPGGDLANGFALVGLYSDDHPANDNRANTEATLYPDGTLLEYDHSAHRHLVKCVGDIVAIAEGNITSTASGDLTLKAEGGVAASAGGSMTIKAAQSIVIEAGASITLKVGAASLTIGPAGVKGSPDIVVENISLTQHSHDKVRTGEDRSGMPVA